MSSILSSQTMVFATAMALSGTVIVLTLCRQKATDHFMTASNHNSQRILRPCLSSDGRKRDKKKKRVHFAEDVVDPIRSGDEFRRECRKLINPAVCRSQSGKAERIPANRMALYNGLLRDRVQRPTCSY